MPVYMTAQYSVRPEELETCLAAIREFVAHVKDHEPGTRMYVALQAHQEPTRFLHQFVFEDEAAEQRHRNSEAVRHFTRVLYPATVEGVHFTTYELVASN